MKTVIIIFFFIVQAIAVSSQDFWEEMTPPDSVGNLYSITFNSLNDTYITTINGVFRSINNGETWEHVAYFNVNNVEISSADELYSGIDPLNRLFYSNSNGQSWDTIQTNLEQGGWMSLIDDSLLFVYSWGLIRKSSDGGYTWDTVLSTNNTEIFNDIIENQGVIFAGSTAFLDPQGGGVNQSLDLGSSWQQISLSGYGVSSFALDIDSNLLCGVRFHYYGQEYGVLRSYDNGFSWNNILWGYIVTSLAVDNNGGIYAGCDSDFGPEGVMFSSDNGIFWEPINSGLHEDASVTSLSISPNGYIYATTVFPTKLYRSINPIVDIKEAPSITSSFNLYPNPCNDFLNIRVDVKSLHSPDNKVLVEIVNSSGEVVCIKNIEYIGGSYISCNISSLQTGLYLVKLQFNQVVQIERFIKY